MNTDELQKIVQKALEDIKAGDIKVLDVIDISSVTDRMVIATGYSTRHVKSIADSVIEAVKKNGCKVLGMEGEKACDWILVDIGDVVLHVMLADVREFYALEKLWAVKDGDDNKDMTA
ncbi:Ribosomal silencing factor RsfA [hydrothermal vent metagenome]|uniref:Ribosomal silencing factor RsfA n=1 Tax=hydrothermal vent metagenome TaxID=652676 RepID=A0A3B0Y6X4_9ZZZZ